MGFLAGVGLVRCFSLAWRMCCTGCPLHDAGTGLRLNWGIVPQRWPQFSMCLGVPSRGVSTVSMGDARRSGPLREGMIISYLVNTNYTFFFID